MNTNYKIYLGLLVIFSVVIIILWCNKIYFNIPYEQLYRQIKFKQDKEHSSNTLQNESKGSTKNININNDKNINIEGFKNSECDDKTNRDKKCVLLYKADGELSNVNEFNISTGIEKFEDKPNKFIEMTQLIEDGALSEMEIYQFLRDYKSNNLLDTIDGNIFDDIKKLSIDPNVQNLMDYNENLYKVYDKHSNILENELYKMNESNKTNINEVLNKAENIRIKNLIKRYIYYKNLKNDKNIDSNVLI
jgi:hypothetical protein